MLRFALFTLSANLVSLSAVAAAGVLAHNGRDGYCYFIVAAILCMQATHWNEPECNSDPDE